MHNEQPDGELPAAALQVLLRQLDDHVVFVDRSGRILLTNDGRFESSSPSASLDDDDEIFRSDGRRYELAEWPAMRSASTGEVISGEQYFRIAADGTRSGCSCHSAPIHHASGHIVGALQVERDVTDRQAAKDLQAYHASLVNNVADGIIATDALDFRVTSWNRGAELLYGFSADEVLGRPAREIASYPGDHARLDLEQKLLEEGRTRIEFTARHKDGTAVEVELIAVALADAEGRTTGYLGIHRDITQRRRAEEELQGAKVRAEEILESIGDAFFAVDREWRYTYLNHRALAQAAAALGRIVTAEELAGQSCWETFPEWVGTPIYDASLRAVGERQTVNEEILIPRVERWFEVRLYPSPDGLLTYLSDITERRRATATLETFARERSLVADLSLRALGEGRLQPLLDDAVRLVAEVLGLELSSIGELEPGGDRLSWRAAFGWPASAIGGATPSSAGTGSLVGYTVKVGEPVVSEDVRDDPRFSISPLFAEASPVSAASVVMPGRLGAFGALVVASRTRRVFDTADIQFMQAVANVVGVAIERAKLDERIEAAREAERTRIARELHDDGLRELTDALGIAALGLSSSLGSRHERRWADVTGRLQRLSRQLRSAIYDLRLGSDEDGAFSELVEDLAALQGSMAVATEVQMRGAAKLSSESLGHRGTEVLRILREAITNARAHSGGKTIVVDAGRSTADVLRIDVIDDGRWPGRESDVTSRRGTGIIGMFERASEVDAALRIEGVPGCGTRISVELPLKRVAQGPVDNQRPATAVP